MVNLSVFLELVEFVHFLHLNYHYLSFILYFSLQEPSEEMKNMDSGVTESWDEAQFYQRNDNWVINISPLSPLFSLTENQKMIMLTLEDCKEYYKKYCSYYPQLEITQ